MPDLKSTLGRPITKTCLVRGREAEGRWAVVVSKVRNTRLAGIGPDGEMTATTIKVPTADVQDVQPFDKEPAALPRRISGVVGKRGVTTLPLEFRRALNLRPDDPVLFEMKDGAIVVHPAQIGLRRSPTAADRDELISRITPDNVHEEFDTGEPVGLETL